MGFSVSDRVPIGLIISHLSVSCGCRKIGQTNHIGCMSCGGQNLAITLIWPDSSSIVLMPKKIGYENSLVVQNGYTHIQSYFLATSCADLCSICLLQVWCLFRIVSHKNVRCFLWVAFFQLVFTHSGSFDSTPWKAIVIFSGGTPGVPTIPNHPTVLAFDFQFQFEILDFFAKHLLDFILCLT